jgi:hypothetical protein
MLVGVRPLNGIEAALRCRITAACQAFPLPVMFLEEDGETLERPADYARFFAVARHLSKSRLPPCAKSCTSLTTRYTGQFATASDFISSSPVNLDRAPASNNILSNARAKILNLKGTCYEHT